MGRADPADQARRLATVRNAYGLDSDVDFVSAVIHSETQMFTSSTQLLTHPGPADSFYERQQAVITWACADRSVILQNRRLLSRPLLAEHEAQPMKRRNLS